ncbi:S8 family serine peptidase [Spirillospora sp. NPDC049652]
MRRLTRSAAAATAAVGLAVIPTVPARATPGPNPNEWWFKGWSIQQLVWPQTKGAGVTVAVIDSGVNAKLPDLKEATVPGGDFSGGNSDGRTDVDSEEGHGTAMASLIASRGTSSGFVGIAPEAKILPIVVRDVNQYSEAKAIRFAVDHGAKVVNISQGEGNPQFKQDPCPQPLLDAVKYAAQKDVVLVAAAGNEGDSTNDPSIPGSCPGVLAVGALGKNGKAWASSQRQPYVTVGAPGADVGGIGKSGHVYSSGEGTSQASALTSGAVALLRAKFPQESARRIVQILTNTTKDFGSPDQLGRGVISIPRALRTKVPATAPNPVYERLDKVGGATPKGATGGQTSSAPSEKKSGGSSTMLYVGIGVVVIAVLVVGGVVLMRRGKGKGDAGGPPPAPMGPPSFGQQPGGHTGPQQSPYGGPQQPSGFGQPGGPQFGQPGQTGNGAPQFQPPAGGQNPPQ